MECITKQGCSILQNHGVLAEPLQEFQEFLAQALIDQARLHLATNAAREECLHLLKFGEDGIEE